jgi:Xaa-Pro dipeptidase
VSSINQNEHLKNYRLDKHLSLAGIDAMMCMLPENVVYLTGTYPVHGVSIVIYIPNVGTFLLQPECEQYWVEANTTRVTLFDWGHLQDNPLDKTYADFLSGIYRHYDLNGKRIGVEKHYKTCAPAYRSAEMNLPDAAWLEIVQANLPGCLLKDCVPTLESARAIKSPHDIDKLKRVNQIAQIGLDELNDKIHPGMSEVEAASLVENSIRVNGSGFQGARLVSAFAEATSGPEGSQRQSMLIPAGQRKFDLGDLVIIEMAVVADGYWSDLTRVFCVGKPNEDQKRIFNTVLSAQKAAATQLIGGNKFSTPDAAARNFIMEAGLGEYFIHGTGHGVGWRYHEGIPQLGPESEGILETGMVTSVEPGVYIPGFGGIRIEDNLAVGDTAPVWLSNPVDEW